MMQVARRYVVRSGIAASLALGATGASAKEKVLESTLRSNKVLVADFIEVVWRLGQLEKLSEYWTANCLNHADASPNNRGLEALRLYHEQFGKAFAAFQDPKIEIEQQIAEDDRVVTQMVTRARHASTGKFVSLATIRIDRLNGGKIAEHWSVADMAGLMQQIAA